MNEGEGVTGLVISLFKTTNYSRATSDHDLDDLLSINKWQWVLEDLATQTVQLDFFLGYFLGYRWGSLSSSPAARRVLIHLTL